MIIHHLFLGDFHRPPVLSYSALSTYLRTYVPTRSNIVWGPCTHAIMLPCSNPHLQSPISMLSTVRIGFREKPFFARSHTRFSVVHSPRPSNFARRLFSGCGCQRIGLSLLIISDNFGIKIDLLHSQKQSVSRRSAP